MTYVKLEVDRLITLFANSNHGFKRLFTADFNSFTYFRTKNIVSLWRYIDFLFTLYTEIFKTTKQAGYFLKRPRFSYRTVWRGTMKIGHKQAGTIWKYITTKPPSSIIWSQSFSCEQKNKPCLTCQWRKSHFLSSRAKNGRKREKENINRTLLATRSSALRWVKAKFSQKEWSPGDWITCFGFSGVCLNWIYFPRPQFNREISSFTLLYKPFQGYSDCFTSELLNATVHCTPVTGP